MMACPPWVLYHPQALCALRLPDLLKAGLQRSRLVPHTWGNACTSARLLNADALSLAPSIHPPLPALVATLSSEVRKPDW